jgi:DNA-binding transcriptional MerR regulator
MDEEKSLSIGELAESTGFAASAIRYYESVGVLPEPSRSSGQRKYDQEMVERLGMLDAAQRAGFTLDEITTLFRSSDEGRVSVELRGLATERLEAVRQLIERAGRMKVWLEQASDCGCQTMEECSLFSEDAPVGDPVALKLLNRKSSQP